MQPYLQAAQTAQTQGAGALGQAATAVGGLGAIQNQAGNIAQGQGYDRTTSLPTFHVSISINKLLMQHYLSLINQD